jgi:replicative DNA helicase
LNDQELQMATKDAEQELLGALLIDRDAMPSVNGIVIPEAFQFESHRVLYQAMLSMWEKRIPCDPATAIAEVRLMGYGEEKFPFGYIATLVTMVGTAVHAPFYARNVMNFAKRRAMIEAGSDMVKAAYGPEFDTCEILHAARAKTEPFEQDEQYGPGTMQKRTLEYAEHTVERWEGTRLDPLIPSGIKPLDRIMTGGFRPGQLIMVGARPGMGKTALMVELGIHTPTHLVSLEMTEEEILNRVICNLARVPHAVAHDKLGDVRLREKWIDGAVAASKLGSTIADGPRQTTLKIESDLARLIAEQGIRMAVIDHLDWLADNIRVDSQEQRTAELVRRCKRMAKALNIPIVVLAQLNRNVEQRTGFVPYLSDFRNSGSIEQDADVALLLYRRRYYSERGMLQDDPQEDWITATNMHKAEIIVAKNRNGSVGTVRMGWQPDQMRFVEVAA